MPRDEALHSPLPSPTPSLLGLSLSPRRLPLPQPETRTRNPKPSRSLYSAGAASRSLSPSRAPLQTEHAFESAYYALRPLPSSLNPKPYTLPPTPYSLNPTPCTLHPTPYSLNPAPCTYQMAFESAEELYGVLSHSGGNARKAQKSSMMLNYYDKISQVFWVSVRPPPPPPPIS